MTNHPPDRGGVFTSDTHRRVAGSLPLPDEAPIALEDLFARVDVDEHTLVADTEELQSVLGELATDGFVKELKSGWRLMAAGLSALTGPIANEPPPLEGAALEAAEAHNEQLAAEEKKAERQAVSERVERARAELEKAKAAEAEVAA